LIELTVLGIWRVASTSSVMSGSGFMEEDCHAIGQPLARSADARGRPFFGRVTSVVMYVDQLEFR
jgi:hypothetical protein